MNEIKNLTKDKINIINEEDNKNFFYTSTLDFEIDNLKENITEIHYDNGYFDINVDEINKFIDKLKLYNKNNIKLVHKLPLIPEEKNELLRIKDKIKIEFKSENDLNRFSVDDLIKIDEILDLFVNDIKTSNLSNYEKYIAVYDIVKGFKKYNFFMNNEKIDEKIGDQSRSIYLILLNDYIVCLGYAILHAALQKKVGNNCFIIPTEDHALNLTNIVDEKYNINGYYYSDVTMDSERYYSTDKYDKLIDFVNYYSNFTFDEYYKLYSNNINIDLSIKLFSISNENDMLNYLIEEVSSGKTRFDSIKSLFEFDKDLGQIVKNQDIDLELSSKIIEHFRKKNNKEIDMNIDLNVIMELKQFVNGTKYSKSEYLLNRFRLPLKNYINFNKNNNTNENIDEYNKSK